MSKGKEERKKKSVKVEPVKVENTPEVKVPNKGKK